MTNTMSLANKNEKPAKVDAPAAKEGYVVVAHEGGRMLHLFTDIWIDKVPKKMIIDDFVQCQVDAGKLKIVQP